MPADTADAFPMRNGLNLGGWLSQSSLTDRHVADFITEERITQIADWGFDHVRLPLDWNFVLDGNGRPTTRAVRVLTQFHTWTARVGLRYILDLHETPDHTFTIRENPVWSDPAGGRRLADFWLRLLDILPDHHHLAIDLLNEPTTRDPHAWSRVATEVTGRLRPTTPDVWIIIEAADRGTAATCQDLAVPDRRCVLGIHFYEPIAFTHQQAFWADILPYARTNQGYPGNLAPSARPVPDEFQHCFDRTWDRAALAALIEPVAIRARELGVPAHCGEFGVFLNAPRESRYAWLADVVAILTDLGIGRCYWSYRNMGFGVVYDEGDHARLPEYRRQVDYRLLSILQGSTRPEMGAR